MTKISRYVYFDVTFDKFIKIKIFKNFFWRHTLPSHLPTSKQKRFENTTKTKWFLFPILPFPPFGFTTTTPDHSLTHSLLFLFSLHAELRENQKQIKPPFWFLPPFLLSTKSRVSAVEFEESFLISVVCFFQFPQVVEEDHHGFGRKSWWKNWSAYAVQTLVRAGGTISFFFWFGSGCVFSLKFRAISWFNSRLRSVLVEKFSYYSMYM